LFAEIQTAYEVLSDTQERAWYDSHEAAILRGGDGGEEHYEHNVRVMTADDITAMMSKFHGRIDYSDSPTGFFGFLRETFERLAKEEEVAADWEGLEVPDYPLFGHKDDTYEDVVKDFYAGWGGFATKKTFAWKDKFRMSDAPDRRYRRAMEKENKKLRDEGIREFNDAVRTLVAFVRKRDPRYTPNTQTDAQRQQTLQEARKAQAAKARAANAVKADEEAVPEWARARDPDELDEESEEEIEEEHFECVACNKIFKSEKQFEAHERSKKHQKAVQALRRKMQKDGQRFGLDEEDLESSGVATPVENDVGEAVAAAEEKSDPIPELKELKVEDVESEEDESLSYSETEAPTEQTSEAATPETALSDDEDSDSDSDYAPRSKVKARLQNSDPFPSTSTPAAPAPTHPPDDENKSPAETKKLGKAAQKRAKKAAKGAAASQEDLHFKCAVCNSAFPSRTRLFQHINDFGHAALKSATAAGGKGKGKKK
jgi:DnaJ homolog subfamily A member 5